MGYSLVPTIPLPPGNWLTRAYLQLGGKLMALAQEYGAGLIELFHWPLPEKGLAKRLHRVSAPTLIIWGEHDHLIPSGYASEFAHRIPGSYVVLIPEAGHTPQLEHLDATYAAVASFLP